MIVTVREVWAMNALMMVNDASNAQNCNDYHVTDAHGSQLAKHRHNRPAK